MDAASTQMEKVDNPHSGKRLMSCAFCYQQKRKCDKSIPCSQCMKHNVDCQMSSTEAIKRPRKRRFAEAELLVRIAKYESALLSYGADLDSIRGCSDADKLSPADTSMTAPEEVTASFIEVIEGRDSNPSAAHPKQSWYDDLFAQDGTSLLFAVDPPDVASHAAPFDILKLWQTYYDNIHPISKLLHAPTFQRKMASYGSLLHLAPSADQALFFAVYTAAISSISTDQCQTIFCIDKESILEQYKLATQVWLRRANIWQTSDITVLQAFILFLSSIQNSVDPRTLACFTGVAHRIARRMGLHRDNQSHTRILEQETRTRVWWELILLDAKAVERSGLGTSVSTGVWDARLPLACSDVDIEALEMKSSLNQSKVPSSEMICSILRVEVALFVAELHNERIGRRTNRIDNSTLTRRLECIDEFEQKLQVSYLNICNAAIPVQRLAILFARISLSRICISAYIVEDSSKASIGIQLLKHCVDNLDFYNQMRSDSILKPFKWFIIQQVPVFGYINLLRLLQEYTEGGVVERAWQTLQSFKSIGPRKVADALTLKAWNARKNDVAFQNEEPEFIRVIRGRSEVAMTSSQDNGTSKVATDMVFTEADMMALMAEILSNEVYTDLDWTR